MLYKGVGNGMPFGPSFTTGDVVGCGIDFYSQIVFFTKNGVNIGSTEYPLDRNPGPLYCSVGLRTPNETVLSNLGRSSFEFDILNYAKVVLMHNM